LNGKVWSSQFSSAGLVGLECYGSSRESPVFQSKLGQTAETDSAETISPAICIRASYFLPPPFPSPTTVGFRNEDEIKFNLLPSTFLSRAGGKLGRRRKRQNTRRKFSGKNRSSPSLTFPPLGVKEAQIVAVTSPTAKQQFVTRPQTFRRAENVNRHCPFAQTDSFPRTARRALFAEALQREREMNFFPSDSLSRLPLPEERRRALSRPSQIYGLAFNPWRNTAGLLARPRKEKLPRSLQRR